MSEADRHRIPSAVLRQIETRLTAADEDASQVLRQSIDLLEKLAGILLVQREVGATQINGILDRRI